jgi:hypothetical protein
MKSNYELFSPVELQSSRFHSLAPGLDTLNGKTVGILSNQKINADTVLERLAGELGKRFGLGTVVKHIKTLQSQEAPAQILNDLAERSDFVISGVGD